MRIASEVQPSARGELEITSVNNEYLQEGKLQVVTLSDEYSWYDAGTADSLYVAAGGVKREQESTGKMIACLEEIAFENGWITIEQLRDAARRMEKTVYGEYLVGITAV